MRWYRLFSAFLFLILMVSPLFMADLLAQPAPPGGGDPDCWPTPCIPIDGGISYLIAAGLLYGGKKAFDASKKEKAGK